MTNGSSEAGALPSGGRLDRIETTLQTMLSVQRELQESQIKTQTELNTLERVVSQLVGYSISAESEACAPPGSGRLDLQEQLQHLKARVRRLEESA